MTKKITIPEEVIRAYVKYIDSCETDNSTIIENAKDDMSNVFYAYSTKNVAYCEIEKGLVVIIDD